ncbi:MAG: type I methionyl aminopeptidase [Lachnospiraceae bacterium]|nr:type I methionyl aminopeptidase [Lachnospiraceae bacterium]
MVSIKSDREIELMRDAGKILALVHNEVADYIKPGLTTYEIDRFAEKIVKKHNATCSFYHLYDFPGNFCISINDEVIHGIPSKNVVIKDGDIIKIDGGVNYKGYQSDAARTHIVGSVSQEVRDLVERTKQAFFEGIKFAVPGNHINDISTGIEMYIEQFGYGIVEDYVGHGIGTKVHEDPEIPNFATTTKGIKIKKNMTFAVEPMVNLGTYEVFTADDNWTVKTCDGKASSHYENTIVITDNGPEILSLI